MSSPSKITIAQVLPALTTGGVERGAIDVSKELIKKKYQPIIISAGGELESNIEGTGIKHLRLNVGHKGISTFFLVKKLSQIFLNENVDIVHARSRLPAWISKMALKKIDASKKIAWVTTVHGPYTVNLYSKIMTSGDKVIAVSDFIKDYIETNYDIDQKKIITIPRGVDVNDYYPSFKPDENWFCKNRQLRKWLSNKPVLTLAGRLTSWKGQEAFLSLLSELKQRKIDFRGLVVGGANRKKVGYHKFLNEKTQQLGLSECVKFLGNRPDLKQILSISTMTFSLTSKPEAFGRTTAESLSLGTPVIGYEHGGTGEILRKWFPDGLIDTNNISKAAEKVEIFLTRPPKVPSYNHFPLQNMLDETIKLYTKIYHAKHK